MTDDNEIVRINAELAKTKADTAQIFTAISRALSSQIAATVGITQLMSEQGLLSQGEGRKEHFSSVRKALADLEALNDKLIEVFSSTQQDITDKITDAESRIAHGE